ncbi:lasso RiPP family leader peptide-containing protein [Streptomyces sp. NPDC059008]|uniref:lasso RiPP family leader peptide-containing protein n=1 Tax=Streptomyces sp. NPDC059008 TaxID=3346693 RepID=UPI0036C8F4FB
MIETQNFEMRNVGTADVYEAPLLTEVGDFADLTQGNTGLYPEAGATWYVWS